MACGVPSFRGCELRNRSLLRASSSLSPRKWNAGVSGVTSPDLNTVGKQGMDRDAMFMSETVVGSSEDSRGSSGGRAVQGADN